jgi:hypothetical protein
MAVTLILKPTTIIIDNISHPDTGDGDDATPRQRKDIRCRAKKLSKLKNLKKKK